MNIKMRKGVLGLLLGIAIVLCTIFSFSIIFINGNKTSANGGIVAEDGANVSIIGGILQDNNQAIIIGGGEHTISNVKISGSTNGAVIIAAGSIVTIENSIIEGNTNTGNGGAIFVGEGATLTLENTKILNNTTTANGGAIYACANSVVQISGTTSITGNSGNYGGGIYLESGAVLNDGKGGLEYFRSNTSSSNTSIWQNVYYSEVDIKLTLAGLTSDEETNVIIEQNISTQNIFNVDLRDGTYDEYNDYYIWLNNTLNEEFKFDEKLKMTIHSISEYEGCSDLTIWGGNKLKYTLNSQKTAYSVSANNKELLKGKLIFQSTFNNLPVEEIEENAFQNCMELSGELLIPNSVVKIGNNAFENASFTETLTLSNNLINIGDCAFHGCKFTSTLTIPNSVKTIGSSAFSSTNFSSLEFGNSVENIGNHAFSYNEYMCGNLIIPASVVKIGDWAFYEVGIQYLEFETSDHNIEFGRSVFQACSDLAGVYWSTGAKTISHAMFQDCSNLDFVTFPYNCNLEYIGDSAFSDCEKLFSDLSSFFQMPKNLIGIGDSAFFNCNIYSVVFNSKLEYIEDWAFYDSIIGQDISITIPRSVMYIGKEAFFGCSIHEIYFENSTEWFVFDNETDASEYLDLATPPQNTSYLTNIYSSYEWQCPGKFVFTLLEDNTYSIAARDTSTISGTLTLPSYFRGKPVSTIPNRAFYNCTNLTGSLVIPNTVKTIGSEAFRYSAFNGTLTLGNSLEYINGDAFDHCLFTGDLIIPDSVISIGSGVFSACSGFTGNIVIGNGIQNIPAYAFSGLTNATGTLTLGNNIETIGNYSFQECACTGALVIPNSVKSIGNLAFRNLKNVTGSLTFGNNITSIGTQAFENSTFTGDLTIPNSVITINNSAFKKTAFNGNLILSNALITLGNDAFDHCLFTGDLIIPDSVTRIGSGTFSGCSGFTGNVVIGNGVVSIGNYAFSGLTSVKGTLTIGENVQTIGTFALQYISFTGDLIIPDSVISIGKNAFQNSNKFSGNVLIGASVESLGENLFKNCSNLTSVTFKNINGWFVTTDSSAVSGTSLNVNDPVQNATWFKTDYLSYIWKTDGGFVYTLLEDGTYAIGAKDTSLSGDLIIPEYYKGIAVTQIAENGFANCTNLTGKLVISDKITIIGKKAFYGAGFKGTLTIGNNVTTIGNDAFDHCLFTGDLIIPDSVISIASGAFSACSGFTGNVVIGNGVVSIGNYAFSGLTSVKGTLTIGENVQTIGTFALQYISFTGDLIIPDSVISIGKNAFQNSNKFSGNVLIGASVESLGENLFKNCSNLTSVTFKNINGWFVTTDSSAVSGTSLNVNDPVQNATWFKTDYLSYIWKTDGGFVYTLLEDGTYAIGAKDTSLSGDLIIPEYYKGIAVTQIAENGFANCTNLTGKLVISDKITIIGKKAFYGAGFKGTLTIGNNVTTIGNDAFDHCLFTGDLIIPDSVISIASGAFSACSGFTGNVVIGNGVVSIGNYAFSGLTNAKGTITLGNSLQSIGGYAFQYASCVGNVIIPESVTKIDTHAFYNCGAIIGISIPRNVTSLNRYTFGGCVNLESIYINAENTKYTSRDNNNNEINAIIDNSTKTIILGSNNATIIPEGVVKIGEYAFYNYKKLKSITIPESIECIEQYAFNGCTGLEAINYNAINCVGLSYDDNAFNQAGLDSESLTVTIGNKVKKIPSYLFGFSYVGENFVYVSEIIFEETSVCETIESYAFGWCLNIESIAIPDSISTIQAGAFCKCSKLKSVYVSDVNIFARINFGSNDANPLYYASDLFKNGNHVTELVLDTTDSVGQFAFYNAINLHSITIGKNVNTIAKYAFYNCVSVEEINYNSTNCADFTADYHVFDKLGVDGNGVTLYIGNNVEKVPAYFMYLSATGNQKLTDIVFDESSLCATVGDYAFYNSSFLKNLNLATSVINIGQESFYGCTSLTSISIPKNVVNIGNGAFKNCSYINEIYFNAANCADLTNDSLLFYGTGSYVNTMRCVIGKDVERIPAYLMYDPLTNESKNYYVETVEFEEESKCVTVGGYAFANCKYLTSVTLGSCVELLGGSAFTQCANLKEFKFSSSLTTIEGRCFYNCDSLVDIEVPIGVTSVGGSCFLDCDNLLSVVIPEGVTMVESWLFNGCDKLISVTIPASASMIYQDAFHWCSNLEYIVIDEENAKYSSSDANNNNTCIINKETSTLIVGTKNTVIPSDVTTIASYAFNGRTNITSIVIPSNVTLINASAFNGCTNLSSVEFENPSGWTALQNQTDTTGTSLILTDAEQNASYFLETYKNYYWKKRPSPTPT